jgi:regulator of protease activity HflC (stomatin/prohibitin superfamily)
MDILGGMLFGFVLWFFVRYGVGGFYTIGPSERAVVTTFGRAQRLGTFAADDSEVAAGMRPDEKARYSYPQVRVVTPGFYWKLPWQQVHKVSVATVTLSIGFDPEDPSANHGGRVLEAVTKDQLNIGLTGQLRYTVSERNLYAYLFGVKAPIAHVMGYFISILRDRIANFQAPDAHERAQAHAAQSAMTPGAEVAQQISINDLRKHLRALNEHMSVECAAAAGRYGIALDAALITGIDPPHEVENALAAINTAHNQISSEISLAQASADQKIVMSRRAVEIETLNAEAEVQPLLALANQLNALKEQGSGALRAYVRNARLGLFHRVTSMAIEHETEVKS